MRPIFISGIGTGVGKTLVAAILAEALNGQYWKPVQAGDRNGTDSDWIKSVLTHPAGRIYPEAYKLRMAASPHIAAREEGIRISLDLIAAQFKTICEQQQFPGSTIIIEGVGGLMVPLNENELVIDLVKKLHVSLLLVSRNYLGSINHSLLTAAACQWKEVAVTGWIFNDRYLDYEAELSGWTGISKIASIPFIEIPGKEFVRAQADILRDELREKLFINVEN